MFYTYIWRDSTGVPFYVGKGVGRRAREVYPYRRSAEFMAEYAKGGCFVEIVDDFIHESDSLAHEIELIEMYGRRDDGGLLINKTDGGEGQSGRVVTDETRKKLSIANSGRRPTPETRAKMSAAQKGKTLTLEARDKISRARQGIVFSEDHRKNIGLSQRGHTRWLGRRHTPETIEKLRALHDNRSEETRMNISLALSGRELDDAHKANISAGMKMARPRGRYKGVSFDKAKSRWSAKIKLNGKTVNLGRFKDAEGAARAYDKAALEAWGAGNCYLNFPVGVSDIAA